MSDESTTHRIEFELLQIEQLLASYQLLLRDAQQREPGLVEVTAIASVLHSFYNGIENIFVQVARAYDHSIPTGDRWHQELLQSMARPDTDRGAVISLQLAADLATYLAFRHFFRHSYTFVLDWEKLQPLVLNLESVWRRSRTEVTDFIGRS